MESPSLADLLIAPLALLERSKGWTRRGLVLVYLLVVLATGVFGWRAASLWGLPKSPEPFDLAKYGRVELPDADNAMVAYRAVVARFGELDSTKGYTIASTKAWDVTDWPEADPEVRRWVEDHRPAVEAWLPANDRRDSLLLQPEDLRMSSPLGPAHSIRIYVRLALLEGLRLEAAGDLAGAWRMDRAVLRASRLVGRHGGTIQHLIGYGFLKQACPRVEAWSDRPEMTADLLRRALGDVEACRAMTSPASEMVRAEYFSTLDTLNNTDLWANVSDQGPYSSTDWTNFFGGARWARRVLNNEPERSARVHRLITAGYLAQCDRPRSLRTRLLFPDSLIYDLDPGMPAAVRSIAPQDLESWYKGSFLALIGPYSNFLQAFLDAEAGMFDRLRLKLATRAFEIERGRLPKVYGELLGPYLEDLPAGIEPGDPMDPGVK